VYGGGVGFVMVRVVVEVMSQGVEVAGSGVWGG
jgi:hypothetical protein